MVQIKRLCDWLKSNWLTAAIWVGTLLVVNWTLLAAPMFYTHDYLHGARIAEFSRGLLEGQFPVIWSQNFGFGFGMPLFEFYAPLPYFVGAIFYLAGVPLLWSAKAIMILANLGTMVGMYLWAREFYRRDAASLAAAFLTLASYRAMDLFARGAVSELWGIMCVAWFFAGLTRLIRREKAGFWLTVLGGSMLALSHNITFMITAPVAVVYALVLLIVTSGRVAQKHPLRALFQPGMAKQYFWRGLGSLALAAVTILGLTAFYWLPALAEKNATQVDTYILDAYFDFHIHFLYARQLWRDQFGYGGSGWGPEDGLSFFLGWAQWFGFILGFITAAIIMLKKWTKNIKLSRQKVYNIIIFTLISILFACTTIMSLYRTTRIWELLSPVLSFVQFPWRFLGVSISLLSLAAAWCVVMWPTRYRQASIVFLWLLAIMTSAHYFRGATNLEITRCETGDTNPACGQLPYYVADPDYIRTVMSPVLVDYLPRDFANYQPGKVSGSLDWTHVDTQTHVLSDMPQPEMLIDRMHAKLYHFQLEASREAELAVAGYPGWQVEINGEPGYYHLSERGNIVVALPAGDVRVGLYLDDTPLRRLANWLSLLTLIIIIGEGTLTCRRQK